MKNVCFYEKIYPLFLALIFFNACSGQEKPLIESQATEDIRTVLDVTPESQIAEYIRHIFQDKNGNLWFGTNAYGVAHYDGDSVSYFSNAQGFGGQQITGITEDPEKNIWFATDQGVVKYDWSSNSEGGKQFTNYAAQPYFGGQRFWSIFADSKGTIWAGAVTGIFRYDGLIWAPFELPFPEKVAGKFITKGTSWSISEDRSGNMWFSTNGFGAFKYDGKSLSDGQALYDGQAGFTQYSEKDGLTDNSVDHIMEDRNGNIWFGTRFGGVSRYDGNTFTNYTSRNSIGNNEVCVIYEDKKGNIWFSSEGFGVYCYNGVSFTNYGQKQGLGVRAVQTIFEDKEGRLWVGGGGGLYRYDPSASLRPSQGRQLNTGDQSFLKVTKDGPWE